MGAELIDVNGSFARLTRNLGPETRRLMAGAIRDTTRGVLQYLQGNIPHDPSPDDPDGELKDALSMATEGLFGEAGVLDNPKQAEIALYNEYSPNHQPTFRPAAESEAGPFESRAKKALGRLESLFSVSV